MRKLRALLGVVLCVAAAVGGAYLLAAHIQRPDSGSYPTCQRIAEQADPSLTPRQVAAECR